MSESPIRLLLGKLDQLDVDGAVSLFAPDGRFVTADGRHASGTAAIHELMSDFIGQIRTMTHELTSEWHPDDVWIAEVKADYVLQDWLELKQVPRTLVLRTGSAGLTDVCIYGQREARLAEHGGAQEGMVVGGRWVPPL